MCMFRTPKVPAPQVQRFVTPPPETTDPDLANARTKTRRRALAGRDSTILTGSLGAPVQSTGKTLLGQ